MVKKNLGINVFQAAQNRIAKVFADFPRVCVSFSGGKDSTVLLHMVMDEAQKRRRRVDVMFIDWEAQYKLTIEHIEACINTYKDNIENAYWIALPLLSENATSMDMPTWTCWEPGKENIWVRQKPKDAISDEEYFPFYKRNMTFEEFVPAFGQWFAKDKLSALFIGLRCGESLNRWRAVCAGKKQGFENLIWTTWAGGSTYNVYPIYDWTADDIWIFYGKTGNAYNPLYDRMHQAGLTINQMRVDEPFGYSARRGLWLYHLIEPETWTKLIARVSGANTGALYCQEVGNMMGNGAIAKPEAHSWQSYALFLLDSMPPHTANHYKNKIAIWLKWYKDRGYPDGVPDELPDDLGAKDTPSWRRVCKILLRNDYWCKGLSFSPTKTAAYQKYLKLMKKRRDMWNII